MRGHVWHCSEALQGVGRVVVHGCKPCMPPATAQQQQQQQQQHTWQRLARLWLVVATAQSLLSFHYQPKTPNSP